MCRALRPMLRPTCQVMKGALVSLADRPFQSQTGPRWTTFTFDSRLQRVFDSRPLWCAQPSPSRSKVKNHLQELGRPFWGLLFCSFGSSKVFFSVLTHGQNPGSFFHCPFCALPKYKSVRLPSKKIWRVSHSTVGAY